ncbi:MAG: hypothetical protein SGARI_001989, partial [Bacillariaceae sp.]
MELLYTNPAIDAFALVSCDSDFTRLAQKIREQGKFVVGFGQRRNPSPFVSACERFVYVENLQSDEDDDNEDADQLVPATTATLSSGAPATETRMIPPRDLALQKPMDT